VTVIPFRYACTWCAAPFPDRAALERHWSKVRSCRANRKVSNQTQSRYNDADMPVVAPGQATLDRVRKGRHLHVVK
jgi:hypothetical protein